MAEPQAKTPEGGEDSMEQILHSIRDIIADDKAAPPADGKAAEGGEEEILELTEVVPATPAPATDTNDALSNIDAALGAATPPAPVAAAPAPADEFPPEKPAEAPKPAPAAAQPAQPDPVPVPAKAAGKKENLVSDIPAKATTAAIKELMDNIPKPKIESPNLRGGSTIEDLVVESLKPMLANWLDKNLPVIVHELVQKEIEKLIPHETRD